MVETACVHRACSLWSRVLCFLAFEHGVGVKTFLLLLLQGSDVKKNRSLMTPTIGMFSGYKRCKNKNK